MANPYFTRLAVDLDPAGNPIGASVTLHDHRDGTVSGIWHTTPGPFDPLDEVWADLVTDFANLVGAQETLF